MRLNMKTRRSRERGAALILTVVVVMILTTLALTMATFTITEERTATTYRDSLQTRAIAEAGARIIQEMFRNPTGEVAGVPNWVIPVYSATATADDPAPAAAPNWDYWGAGEAAIETQLNEIGIWRGQRAGTTPARYSGNQNRLFMGPFKDTWAQVFGGTYNQTATLDQYDLKFNCTNPTTGVPIANATTQCWLDTKINALLQPPPPSSDLEGWNLDSGKITDISFYAPPTTGGRAYGLSTVRVTAVKFDGANVIARETIEAVIIDVTPKPAVLGNGNIHFVVKAGVMCGDGCEQIHANGSANVGQISGGTSPMVTATGNISGGSGSTKPGSNPVNTPEINPWDLQYRPTNATELGMYYLLAARPLDPLWADGIPGNNPNPARPCGLGGYSFCQDYGLEYTVANVAKPRTAANVPTLYRWDPAGQGWMFCDNGNTLAGGGVCPGAPEFNVTPAADVAAPNGGAGDTNDLPFNVTLVPATEFEITSAQSGATILVDGKFYKHGNMNTTMSIIAAGTIRFHAQSDWKPALTNRVMWLSGRDIDTQSNCCAGSNTCATNLTTAQYAAIIAAHEQIKNSAQSALLGVLIGENRVNEDPTIGGAAAASTLNALDLDSGDHGSLCNNPEWPWTMPVTPAIASLKTASN